MLLCSDESIYTGISIDVHRRLNDHINGRGAKYTRSRLPVRLLKFWKIGNHSNALKIEYRIKRLKRQSKLELIEKDSIDFLLKESIR